MNECGTSTAINRTIKHQSLIPIQTRHHETRYRALDEILWHCDSAGFVISETRCEGECCGMMNKVKG